MLDNYIVYTHYRTSSVEMSCELDFLFRRLVVRRRAGGSGFVFTSGDLDWFDDTDVCKKKIHMN